MGLLNRLIGRLGRARASSRGAALEAQGQLEAAYELYQAEGQNADAARVMLARAEAEPDPARRLGLLALAVSVDPDSPAAKDARRRKTLLGLDLLRARPGSLLGSELLALARDLEALALHREAAEVFGLAGDRDNQTRMLVACGAIEALESALAEDQLERGSRRGRQQTWNEAKDLIAFGHRSEAIRNCEAWLREHPDDEEYRALVRTTKDRLVPGPCLHALLCDTRVTVALGEEVTLGRAESTIVLATPVLSRKHLHIQRTPEGPIVRDLQSRNGTLLAGARLAGPVPVGQGIDLSLGGQIQCRLEPGPQRSVSVKIADQLWIVPLGPLQVSGFAVQQGKECVQLLQAESPTAPVLNGLIANVPIDLCRGDEIREEREGPVLLKVLGE